MSCEVLLCQVALQDEAHFLGPESAADCGGVSAVSPAVNHTAWVAIDVTLVLFSPSSSCILAAAGICVADRNNNNTTTCC